MATFEEQKEGNIALIIQKGDRIIQLGISTEHNELLQNMLAMFSKQTPFVQMPEEYDLVLKSALINKKIFLPMLDSKTVIYEGVFL